MCWDHLKSFQGLILPAYNPEWRMGPGQPLEMGIVRELRLLCKEGRIISRVLRVIARDPSIYWALKSKVSIAFYWGT